MPEYQTPAIIPVMDLMIGSIVLATGGDRAKYQPVHTRLISDSRPETVARALFGQTGCDTLYLADLDSFEGAMPAFEIYQRIQEPGFRLWVDADWLSDESRIKQLCDRIPPVKFRPVISTETISSPDQFATIANLIDRGWDPVFSLDLKDGGVLSASPEISAMDPGRVIAEAVAHNVRTVLLLELAKVGTDGGAGEFHFAELNQTYRQVDFACGGGIRNPADARGLIQAGCKHVLVASAIHDCRFTPDDVTELSDARSVSLTEE